MEDLSKDPKIAGLPLLNIWNAGEKTMRMQIWSWVSALLLSAFVGGHAVADIGDKQTFDTPVIGAGWYCGAACLVNGWTGGEIALDAGEDGLGDHAVFYDVDDRGFHFFTWEGLETADNNFLGNLLDAGVVAIRFRARHSGNDDDLVLRAYLFDHVVGWAISVGSATIVNEGADSRWQTYTISLREDDLASGDFSGTPSSVDDVRVVLSGVSQLGLRHDPNTTGPGVSVKVKSAVYFDDIELLFDGDNDGVVDNDDFCPDTVTGNAVDEVGCSDIQVDADSDGVCESDAASGGPSMCTGIDQCSNTVIPEAVPTSRYGLGWYRWTLDNPDGSFTQRNRGKWSHHSFTTEDTRGCSCDQIIAESGYHGFVRRINREYGCSTWVMLHWVNQR